MALTPVGHQGLHSMLPTKETPRGGPTSKGADASPSNDTHQDRNSCHTRYSHLSIATLLRGKSLFCEVILKDETATLGDGAPEGESTNSGPPKSALNTLWGFPDRLGHLLIVALGFFRKNPTIDMPETGREHHLVPRADLSKKSLDMGSPFRENPNGGEPEGDTHSREVLPDKAPKSLSAAPPEHDQFIDRVHQCCSSSV